MLLATRLYYLHVRNQRQGKRRSQEKIRKVRGEVGGKPGLSSRLNLGELLAQA